MPPCILTSCVRDNPTGTSTARCVPTLSKSLARVTPSSAPRVGIPALRIPGTPLAERIVPEAMHRSKAAKYLLGGGGLRVPVGIGSPAGLRYSARFCSRFMALFASPGFENCGTWYSYPTRLRGEGH